MSLILFDDHSSKTLRPLTFTRPVGAIRIGILTVAEKWQKRLRDGFSYKTAAHLDELFPVKRNGGAMFINGSVCPDEALADAVSRLHEGELLSKGNLVIAAHVADGEDFTYNAPAGFRPVHYPGTFTRLVYPEDIFRQNDDELRKDFVLLTAGRTSGRISSSNTILGSDFFAEEGAVAECSTFNSLGGPVYLSAGSEVWEGCNIRGSFSLGEHSQLKMGAKIYGGTSIGPQCRIGGEVNNAVIFGYSSKGHDGFLGNAVVGEWCNIGAGSNNSNLKNNYSEVKLWNYAGKEYRQTGLQFCGLIMGDHAKCGINTMFNTGTVAGVGANIYGCGYQAKFIPDFCWGEAHAQYDFDKFIETARLVYERRNRQLTLAEEKMLKFVFEEGAAVNPVK